MWPSGEVLRGDTAEIISRFDQMLKEALKGGKTDHEACVLWLRLIGLAVAGKGERHEANVSIRQTVQGDRGLRGGWPVMVGDRAGGPPAPFSTSPQGKQSP